jgi:16S rRNA (cytosine1402-N4)-methyltransferase
VGGVHALLADFGANSIHFDVAGRGFSFSREGPLDMRFDPVS